METIRVQVRQAQAGRPFTLAVRDAVHEAKGGDPLRPVTVLAPSNTAGLSLRRLVGSNDLDEAPTLGPHGIANVAFATPFQFAATVAASELAAAGQRPLTTAVLAAAVRHVLREHGGRFAAVAHHTATETALVRAYAELSELDPVQKDQLRASGSARASDLVNFTDLVAQHLSGGAAVGYHDEAAVFEVASRCVRAGSTLGTAVVLAGPYEQGATTTSFLQVVAHHLGGIAVVALTGDRRIDEVGVGQVAAICNAPTAVHTVQPRPPDVLIPASDSDEEVRAVVREVLALARSGARFDRMAVFHPASNPYARTLREQFDTAGVPTAGPDHRTLGDTMVGRLLIRILGLATVEGNSRSTHFDREGVLSLVAAAPVRGPDGRSVRAGSWENVSRIAGVIGGIDDWRKKLQRHGRNLEERLIDPMNQERSSGWLDSVHRERASSKELLDFAEWIHGASAPERTGSSWRDRSRWARELLFELLPATDQRIGWPEEEAEAADRIDVILGRVGVLDPLEPDAPWAAFVRAVELELGAPAGSRGRFGTGVYIAPLASSAGLDLDHVFIVGMAEGLCPRPIREDTLLSDEDRAPIAPALPMRNDRLREDRRRYLTALAAGTSSVTLVTPMGDHRNGRLRTVSRWWLEAMRLLGSPEEISSQSWSSVDLDELRPAGSFSQATRRAIECGIAISSADLQLHRVLVGDRDSLDAALRLGARMQDARQSGFTRFGGDLAGQPIPTIVGPDSITSASRLEAWATCPRRFFFGQVLGLGIIEAPDKITEITALDRGSLWHNVLEDFMREALPGEPHAPATPGDRWSDADRDRLVDHARRRFAEYEEKGLTGRPLLWEIEKEKLRTDLDRFLDEDSDLRAQLESTPEAVELAIGIRTGPEVEASDPVVITLPDGRTMRVRGFADRVDRRTDGSPVVLDYKTGSSQINRRSARSELAKDPVVGGTKLQLGVYAEAAEQHYRTDRAAAHYWYTSDKGGFEVAGYEWTERHKQVFGGALQVIVDGIEGGLFPPNPGEYNYYFGTHSNCGFCEFDSVCPRDRDQEHAAALEDGRLAGWIAMKNPEPFGDADGASA